MAPCTTNRIVPTRFLTLISHFTIAVIALWAKDENVQASLPVDHTASDFSVKANEMTVGLSLAIAFIGLELVGFLSGVSFFMPFISLISIAAHSSATVLLAHFLFDVWNCEVYWWIFAFCSALPAVLEVGAFMKLLQQL
ncbi:transmembrane protein 107-like isoform X1 [Thrips palmi]|uniref:Transmembrane protein 107 n=1 Tax=Thrips palmi TaxID=161013 RepID=A0A6P8ZUV9_THRPL|nr:transmembrane protein 107-like isoform X1 [Thrips palmi]